MVGIAGGYSEARSYQRGNDARGGGDADGERQRVVWRKLGAAEVGLVMLRRIEGRIPIDAHRHGRPQSHDHSDTDTNYGIRR